MPDYCCINSGCAIHNTYDHRLRKTGHPVRSAIHKPQIGRLVVGWVTTSESLLLYVPLYILCIFFGQGGKHLAFVAGVFFGLRRFKGEGKGFEISENQ